MTRARTAIFVLMSMSSLLSVFWGFALERSARGIIVDFKVVYYGARCLLQHHDPYNEAELMKVYLSEGEHPPSSAAELLKVRQVVGLQVYFPTAFLCIAPFAMLPWWAAHSLWAALTVIAFTTGAFLIWTFAQNQAQSACFYLICLLLANSGILFAGGNLAGLAIGLCLISVWCIVEARHPFAAVLCLATSLALKPHDAGPVWLYFLLAGGLYRKRALQTLLVISGFVALAALWVSSVSPHWIKELTGNLAATSARGGITDPGPAGMSGTAGGSIIDLQAFLSMFRDQPGFYNAITYLTCGILFTVWMIVTVRATPHKAKDYFGLAAISALSLLPLYHRAYDAKILVLTIPAMAILMAEGGPVGWIALLLNTATILLTSDIPMAMLGMLAKNQTADGPTSQYLLILLTRPVPVALSTLSCFYLWIYIRHSRHKNQVDDSSVRLTFPGSEERVTADS